MHKKVEYNVYRNWIYIYQKNNFNNTFYQLEFKYHNDCIINIAKKDNNSILLLSQDKIDKQKLILSIIKINGFKIIKKIDSFKPYSELSLLFDEDKTYCFMNNKTIMIHLEGIFLIDLLNNDYIIYEIPGYDIQGVNWVYRIYYDEYKKCFFFLNDSLSIIEINKKEKAIERKDNLVLEQKDSLFLFLMDDILITRDRYSGKEFKKNYVTYFLYK